MRAAFILGLCLPLLSCATDKAWKTVTVGSQAEVGEVLLTVTSVTPWSQIADALQPRFDLSGDQALNKSLLVSQRETQQLLSAARAALIANLAGSETTGGVKRKDAGDGKPPTVTSEFDNKTAPGARPTVAEIGAALPTSPSSPPAKLEGVSVDEPKANSLLQYQAARSLFESVQMMNREVVNAAVRRCYVPFLVRFRLTVQSDRFHLGYNIRSRVGFFPPSEVTDPLPVPSSGQSALSPCGDAGGGRAPVIVPIVASDDIERAISAQTVQVARQIKLSLTGLVNGIGLGAGTDNLEQSIENILGQDYNTRLSVAREVDNVLSVRIGASLQGQGRRALVDQPYEIASLLLVPAGYFKRNDENQTVDVKIIADTTYTDAQTGAVLPPPSDEAILARIDSALIGSLVESDSRAANTAAWLRIPGDKRRMIARRLTDAVHKTSLPQFVAALGEANANVKDDPNTWLKDDKSVDRHVLWTRLAGVVGALPVRQASVQLANPRSLFIPPQTTVLYDDRKTSTTATLHEINGRTVTGLIASLNWIGGADGARGAVAGQLNIDAVNRKLNLTFPSLLALADSPGDAAAYSITIRRTGPCPPEVLCALMDAQMESTRPRSS